MTPPVESPVNTTRSRLLAFWERYGVWLAVVLALGLILKTTNFISETIRGFKAGYNESSGGHDAPSLLGEIIGISIGLGFLTGFLLLIGYVYYRLIHRPLLGKGKLPYTILFVCCFLLFCVLIHTILEKSMIYSYEKTPPKLESIQKRASNQAEIGTGALAICCLLFGVYLDRQRTQKQQRALLQQRTQAQLDALKAQVNPHFLFNSLNNIFGTAMQEQAPRTAESVEQLATIMRYVLKESRNQTTPIERELRFVDDYIQLHKLRLPTLEHIQITTDLYWDESPAQIAPLLLNPLIENAFKYGISIQHPCFVSIRLRVEAGVLTLETRNSLLPRHDLEQGTGMGLANVRERLALAYPGRHTFTTDEADGAFSVSLTINL